MRLRAALLVVFALLLLSLVPSAATAHHQDKGIDSDGDGAQNYDDFCPYNPVPAGDACNGFEDADGDGYTKYQDPCDDNVNNQACDSDGDGEPNQYDPCPSVPSGHMLGSDTPLARQDRSCPAPDQKAAPQAFVNNSSLFGAFRHPLRGLSLRVGLPRGQTRRSILRSGLRLSVRCNRRCTAIGGAFVGRGSGFAAKGKRGIAKGRRRSLQLVLSSKARRAVKRKRKRPPLTIYMASVDTDGRFDSRSPGTKVTVSITSSGVHMQAQARQPRSLSDASRTLAPQDQKQVGNWWIGAARALGGSGCALNVHGIRGLAVAPKDVLPAAAGVSRCDVARVWADIGSAFVASVFSDRPAYYRVVQQLIPRSEGPDQCIQWVKVQAEWRYWTYSDSPGRTC